MRLLDGITASLLEEVDRRDDDFRTLRKGLAYCWSVALVAHPAVGKPLMETWIASEDKDIRWIMKQNLKKARIVRMDAAWTSQQLTRL